jgi:hypothetical protein
MDTILIIFFAIGNFAVFFSFSFYIIEFLTAGFFIHIAFRFFFHPLYYSSAYSTCLRAAI